MTELRPDDTAENPFWYTFKVQCTSCRETHANPISVSRFVGTCDLLKVKALTLFAGAKRGERQSRRGKFCMEMPVLQGGQLYLHLHLYQNALNLFRESQRQLSRKLQNHMSRLRHQLDRRSLRLTVGDLSSPSSILKCVALMHLWSLVIVLTCNRETGWLLVWSLAPNSLRSILVRETGSTMMRKQGMKSASRI